MLDSLIEHEQLHVSTFGAFFFGVPNIGMTIHGLRDIAGDGYGSQPFILNLRRESELLVKQNEEFKRSFIHCPNPLDQIYVFCFIERDETPGYTSVRQVCQSIASIASVLWT